MHINMDEDNNRNYDNVILKHYVSCGFQWQKCIFIAWNMEVVEETKNEWSFGSRKFSPLFADGCLLAVFFVFLSWFYEDLDFLLFVWSYDCTVPKGFGILLLGSLNLACREKKTGRVTLGDFNGPNLELEHIITFIFYWSNCYRPSHLNGRQVGKM